MVKGQARILLRKRRGKSSVPWKAVRLDRHAARMRRKNNQVLVNRTISLNFWARLTPEERREEVKRRMRGKNLVKGVATASGPIF